MDWMWVACCTGLGGSLSSEQAPRLRHQQRKAVVDFTWSTPGYVKIGQSADLASSADHHWLNGDFATAMSGIPGLECGRQDHQRSIRPHGYPDRHQLSQSLSRSVATSELSRRDNQEAFQAPDQQLHASGTRHRTDIPLASGIVAGVGWFFLRVRCLEGLILFDF
jgi:hypothetical protein